MPKKSYLCGLFCFLLIPAIIIAGGAAFRLINPESAAGHPDYARNFRLLQNTRIGFIWGSFLASLLLWLASCFFLLKAKGRSLGWLALAALGPPGFIALTMLRDGAPAPRDAYQRILGGLSVVPRFFYEAGFFLILFFGTYAAVFLKHALMVVVESARTGVTPAQIIAAQNASSGMWAFGEGLEEMYLLLLCYWLWPPAFNWIAGRLGPQTLSA